MLEAVVLKFERDIAHARIHGGNVADIFRRPEALGDGGGAGPDAAVYIFPVTYSAHMAASPPRMFFFCSGVRDAASPAGGIDEVMVFRGLVEIDVVAVREQPR